MCRKCGEDRLTSKVEDPRGVQMVCGVCAHDWWVRRNGTTGE